MMYISGGFPGPKLKGKQKQRLTEFHHFFYDFEIRTRSNLHGFKVTTFNALEAPKAAALLGKCSYRFVYNTMEYP